MRDDKRNFRINMAIVLVLIVIVTVRSLVSGGSGVDFTLTEDSLSFSGPGEFEVSVEFKNLASVAFRENLELGDCITGGSEKGYTYGVWKNEEFGEYALHVLTKVQAYVILTEADGSTVVANFENARTTEDFSKNLIEYLQSMGYLV